MNLTKSFVGVLGRYICKAAHHLGSVDSSNPCHWRGKWLHHHGCDVCCVFVLCDADSSGCPYSYVKKYQDITLKYTYCLTIRLRCYVLTHIGVHHTKCIVIFNFYIVLYFFSIITKMLIKNKEHIHNHKPQHQKIHHCQLHLHHSHPAFL
jgi:hypothetical protein